MERENSDYEIQKIIEPTQELIDAYKDVFNNSAWEEGVKCIKCGFKTTFEKSTTNCPDCNGKIEDFYSNKDVCGFITDVTSKEYYEALKLIGEDDEKVEGFTWGWRDNLDKINKEKLQLKERDYQKLEGALDKIGIVPEKKQFYLSEMGIILKGRGRGLGKMLLSSIQEEVGNKMDSILRTSKKSPMFKLSKNQGYETIFDYNDKNGRVIMALKNI